jgi:hypothetical protein
VPSDAGGQQRGQSIGRRHRRVALRHGSILCPGSPP